MSKLNVSIKWGKEMYNEVEVDLEQSPLMFKSQLFALTGVPPDRQKVMIKGSLLKDEEWGKALPKAGMTVMLMGSAEAVAVEAPTTAILFVEDLPEDEQDSIATKAYGSGLENLGNTCYMNSTLQFLYRVEPLKEAVTSYTSAAGPSDASSKLVVETKHLFKDLERGGAPFAPYQFLTALRGKFPQFSQQTPQGAYMQQDAEECCTNLVYTLREKLKGADNHQILEQQMGIRTHLKLKCEETGEEMEEDATSYVLKCNIENDTNFLHTGLSLGLRDDREKTSAILGSLVKFKGSSLITALPPYLTVQLMRFFYRVDTQQKAKILRKVAFPMELDVYDFCSTELKAQLDGPRSTLKDEQDRASAAAKLAKNKAKQTAQASSSSRDAAPARTATPSADVDMQSVPEAGPSISAGPGSEITGKYELQSVLTHKGRSADSGHYVAWVKQKDGSWILFDDDKLIPKTADEVLQLSGGGDWHMAYMLMYKAILTAPAAPTVTPSTVDTATPMDS
ncbi:MAG: hypothetical protein WDW38_002790 [Sanguina aurantia]